MRWFAFLILSALVGTEAQALIQLRVPSAPLIQGASRTSGDHIASVDLSASSNGLLLILIGGTHSRTQDLLPLHSVAASMGYHVIGIDYPNGVISTTCRTVDVSPDCFLNFRREISFGEDLSPHVDVDAPNSLVARIHGLVKYLATGAPGEWDQFLRDGRVAWRKAVIAGHSQGSGHAAFLSKRFLMHGVLLLAGPQDSNPFGVANWVAAAGKTPGSRYLALLHRDDFFGAGLQIEVARALTGNPAQPVVEFDLRPPRNTAQLYLSTAKVRDAHLALIDPVFAEAWRILLGRLGQNLVSEAR